ncbi:hypothetical protein [Nocardia sp. NPDC060259]|uniref:hypothetical protein n=1 Tax=Nocardia sp. NPDC060259 TaxID=3347088 RepID=UPI00364D45C2
MVVVGFFDVIDVVGRWVRVVDDGRVVVGFGVVVDFGLVVDGVVVRQLLGFGVVVFVVDDGVVVSAGTTTVTVDGGTTWVSVTTPPCCGAGVGIVTLPLSETLGHCDPDGVSVTVVGAGVSVVVSVTVSVTTGSSPLTGSTGAVSVTVTGSEPIVSSIEALSIVGSSPGSGMSLGVSEITLGSVVSE